MVHSCDINSPDNQLQRSDSGQFEVLFLRHFMEGFEGQGDENDVDRMTRW